MLFKKPEVAVNREANFYDIQTLYLVCAKLSIRNKKTKKVKDISWYFLAQKVDGKMKDIYSKTDLRIDNETVKKYFKRISSNVKSASIVSTTPISNYFKLPSQFTIDIRKLFDFVTEMNIKEKIKYLQN